MQPNKIEELKQKFLLDNQHNGKDAMSDALNSALLRGHVYCPDYRHDEVAKKKFKEHWAQCIMNISGPYEDPVSGNKHGEDSVSAETHCKNIVALSDCMTRNHGKILQCGRFRIGTAQKSLNLYLKHLWCMGDIRTPVHCTVDRIILQAAGINDLWTTCDDIDQYKGWIEKLENIAEKEYTNDELKLAKWELVKWHEAKKKSEQKKCSHL